MRPSRVLLMAAACALAGMFAVGCANASPIGPGANMEYVLEYSCCVTDAGTTVWHPGQRVPLDWMASGGQTTGDKMVAQVSLTAVLSGPYRTLGDLNDANKSGPDQSHIVATAPVIKLSSVSVSAPVSVVTIPPSAAPGYYSLWTSAAAGGTVAGMAESADTIITIG